MTRTGTRTNDYAEPLTNTNMTQALETTAAPNKGKSRKVRFSALHCVFVWLSFFFLVRACAISRDSNVPRTGSCTNTQHVSSMINPLCLNNKGKSRKAFFSALCLFMYERARSCDLATRHILTKKSTNKGQGSSLKGAKLV